MVSGAFFRFEFGCDCYHPLHSFHLFSDCHSVEYPIPREKNS